VSTIRKAVEEYLALRRGLGFKLYQEGLWLEQFVSFLESRRSFRITTALALEWATQPAHAQPSYWAHRLSVARGFAQYRAASDAQSEVPPLGLLPCRYQRKPPYIYTDSEINHLLQAAARLPSQSGLRPRTYTTLLSLTARILRDWLRESPAAPSGPLFPNARGSHLSRDGVQYLLRKHADVARQTCPSLRKKSVSPHVLRHSTAMDLLQHGVDHSVIALWLGHESPDTTQIYLVADLALKQKALAKAGPIKARTAARFRPGDGLLQFLKGL